MKQNLPLFKTAALGLFLSLGLSFQSQAQLEEGDFAPDFTYDDINGVSHNLYDYLDQGYSVLITISATWCGPCWSFHQSGTKGALWANHGPAGEPGVNEDTTDDLVVIFIEGDPQTTTDNLNGIGQTQGDWVTGVDYPIIDLPTGGLVQQFGLTGFPNAWMICPNRKITRYYGDGFVPSVMNPNDMYAASQICDSPQGEINPELAAYSGDISIGCEGGSVEVSVVLQNMGNTTMESASIEVSNAGEVVLDYDWTGSLETYQFVNVTLGTLELEGATSLSVAITSENEFDTNSTLEQSIADASETELEIEVRFYTDFYPGESSWEIRNGDNQVVASGGPYQEGPAQFGGGGPDANAVKTHDVSLPAPDGNECYSVVVMDSYGDGLQYGGNPSGQFGLEIFSAGNSIVNLNLGNFGSEHTAPEVMKRSLLSADNQTFMTGLNLFPNPTSGMVNIEFDLTDAQNTQIDIFDVTGKRVYGKALGTMGAGYHMSTIDMSAMKPGVYVVNFTTDKGTEARKLMLTK